MSEQLPTTGDTSTDKAASQTEYVVLRSDSTDNWHREGAVKASSADAAIRQFINGILTTEETLVAVPTRSWKPVRVKPKTVTTLVIEEA